MQGSLIDIVPILLDSTAMSSINIFEHFHRLFGNLHSGDPRARQVGVEQNENLERNKSMQRGRDTNSKNNRYKACLLMVYLTLRTTLSKRLAWTSCADI